MGMEIQLFESHRHLPLRHGKHWSKSSTEMIPDTTSGYDHCTTAPLHCQKHLQQVFPRCSRRPCHRSSSEWKGTSVRTKFSVRSFSFKSCSKSAQSTVLKTFKNGSRISGDQFFLPISRTIWKYLEYKITESCQIGWTSQKFRYWHGMATWFRGLFQNPSQLVLICRSPAHAHTNSPGKKDAHRGKNPWWTAGTGGVCFVPTICQACPNIRDTHDMERKHEIGWTEVPHLPLSKFAHDPKTKAFAEDVRSHPSKLDSWKITTGLRKPSENIRNPLKISETNRIVAPFHLCHPCHPNIWSSIRGPRVVSQLKGRDPRCSDDNDARRLALPVGVGAAVGVGLKLRQEMVPGRARHGRHGCHGRAGLGTGRTGCTASSVTQEWHRYH